ncbi:Oligopeptide transporter 1 [Citrus sinensis]|uniref:Oligopeptide transporter 1 n=1 Tax=Citrus sinensis TaxID=2711 RepID=A0ACB8P1P4_CITSI|nr:Oligopeptide transporter 1 [Citrus sinensis]
MNKNYEAVPQLCFHTILIWTFGLSLYTCERFDKQFQLPWWGLLLACAMAFFFTLPVEQTGLSIELVIGYIYPGRPLANVAFKTYGYISMHKALGFIEDFKLGHYMKIQPKSMFIVQLAGPIDLLITSATQVCCRLGVPGHVLIMMFSTMLQLPGELRSQCWWARHTYILAAALDAGVALMGVILYFTLQCHNIFAPHWWDLAATDNCPLARCPTARGIKVH